MRRTRAILRAAEWSVLLLAVAAAPAPAPPASATIPAPSAGTGDADTTPTAMTAARTEPGRASSAGNSFVLRARTVYPVTPEQPGPIERGMIVVRDGRIAAVGRDLDVPPDLPLIDLRDEVVCPGFVSAASSLAGRHSGPESVTAAYHALEVFNNYGDYLTTLARGTTTVHLDPGGHRLVSGVGAIVKLAGLPEQRVLVPAADLTINLGVFDPPVVFKPPFYASSDVPIEPARRQRPDSRLGQFLELEERVAAAEATKRRSNEATEVAFDVHQRSFAEAWGDGLPLRVQVRRAADIEGALEFIRRHQRPAYLVGLTEGDRLSDALQTADVPIVLRIEQDYRHPGPDIGPDPEALAPRVESAGELAPKLRRLALAGVEGDPREDLALTALLAVRGGMPHDQALAAITRLPAEILGIAARVGSLAPGKDADLLVLTDAPLAVGSHVRRVYVGGQVVFVARDKQPSSAVTKQQRQADPPQPIVVKAGTVWVGDGKLWQDAAGGHVEVLIEDGKIQAVGPRVPHPPQAKVIDAGPRGFVTPGFIDAHGHLGLQGDRTVATPDVPPHLAIAVAGREFQRVARAGVTTVLLAPYRGAPNGTRMAAIKTHGQERGELVARELAGLEFSLRGQDPLGGVDGLRRALQAGKKYDDEWKKYEAELAKWKETRGQPTTRPREEPETVVEQGKTDPLTGTWEFTVSGDPLPEPVSGSMTLRLTGTTVEGRISDPSSGEEANLTGKLDGDQVTLEMEVDTPIGKPVITARLDREDHMTGKVAVAGYSVNFDAARTDKSAVEFKIQRAKRKKDGRPNAPKVDENLEPYRALLAGRIPAVVEVDSAAQINAAIKLFMDEYKLPLVLLDAEGAADIAERLAAHKDQLGVVVPREIEQRRARVPYNEAADLSRRGIRVALQSDSEDGARSLPLMGLFAVQEGLGGDAALKALTIDAARMYKLDDRVGSLEPGKDADVLVFTGHPFDADARLERVIVGGREVPDEE